MRQELTTFHPLQFLTRLLDFLVEKLLLCHMQKEHCNTANLFLSGTNPQCGTETNNSETHFDFEPDIATENGIRSFYFVSLENEYTC